MLIGQRCCCDYNDDSDDNADKIMLDNDDILLDNDNCIAVVNYDDDNGDGETVDDDGRCWLC